LAFFGGIISIDKATLTQKFNTRSDEAKKHLVYQIRNLIDENRINQLGLITLNENAKVNIKLTLNF
jgi:hypothetical protein